MIKILDKPKNIKYRRIIWLGILNNVPDIDDQVSLEQGTRSLKQEIIGVGIYPVLLQWETTIGEKRYAEIDRETT